MKKAPHILLICTDQHAPNIAGFAGDPFVHTPNLDRLAERGTVFENHYCASPICVPGRYAMMTGKLVREIGAMGFYDVLASDEPTYASVLGKAGYQTTCVGKMHFHGQDQMHGWQFRPYGDMEVPPRHEMPGYREEDDLFRRWREPKIKVGDYGGYNAYMLKTARPGDDKFMVFDQSVTRESITHLTDYFGDLISEVYQGTRPLLFEASYKTPHCPFVCPPYLFDRYYDRLPPPAKAPDPAAPAYIRDKHGRDQPADVSPEMIRRARASYWGLVQWVDHQIGQVLDTLDHLGVLDDFVIMYTTDHGEMAGERGLWQKSCFYEESVRCPMILSGPGIPTGKRVRELTSHLDILPTLSEWAGIEAPTSAYGRSLLPCLHSVDPERIVFSEYYENLDSKKPHASVMVRQGPWKLVNYNNGEQELFNLCEDPGEKHNVVGEPEHQRIQQVLDDAISSLPAPRRRHVSGWELSSIDVRPVERIPS